MSALETQISVPASATDSLSAADLWLLAGERRFENLRMPILSLGEAAYRARAQPVVRQADVVALPTSLPIRSQPFWRWLRGASMPERPLDSRVAFLLRHLAAPARFEPTNVPVLHHTVASFGGLGSCGLVLLAPSQNGCGALYRYLPDYHSLEHLGPVPASAPVPPADQVWLACIGQPWLVLEKYGEYAPFGVALDAGLMDAQLRYLTALLGWPRRRVDLPPRTYRRWHLGAATSDLLLSCHALDIAGDASEFLDQLQHRRIATWKPHVQDAERFPLLEAILAGFAAATPAEPETRSQQVTVEVDEPDQRDLLAVMAARTSGNDTSGMAPIQPGLATDWLHRWATTVGALQQRRTQLPAEQELFVRYAWLHPQGPDIGLYDEALQFAGTGIGAVDFTAAVRDCLHNDQQYYNLDEMILEVFIGVDASAFQRRYGAGAIRLAHLAAGARVHDICLAAASFGCFARPVRMFRDAPLERRLELPGQLLIQVLVGVSRRANPAFRLL